MLRFQVTLNPLPLALSGPGWALTAPELLTIVSSSSGNEVITPEFTVAPVSVQVPKLASGRILVPLLGASAIDFAHRAAEILDPREDALQCPLRLRPEPCALVGGLHPLGGGGHGLACRGLQAAHDLGDVGCGSGSTIGERADLLGHHGEAAAVLAREGVLDD